jgi:flagellar motor switch protein FliG
MTTSTALTGPRKAAIALLALDEEVAAAVLAKMNEADIRKLWLAVESVGEVTNETITRALEELERDLTDPLMMARTQGGEYMRKLAHKVLGTERADRLIGGPVPTVGAEPIQLIRTARVTSLAQLLADEHPQVAAVLLTQLPAKLAAKVLSLMPPDTSAELTSRISGLEEIPERAAAEASETLVRALEAVGGLAGSDSRAEFDGLAFSAAMVNEMTAEDGDNLLAEVARRDELVASRIREALFTFEDLIRIAPRELGNLLRAVQSEALVTALQTASTELKDHLLGALSQRAASTLRDDLSAAQPKRLSEVENAQKEIVEATMRLAGEGKITMPQRGAE